MKKIIVAKFTHEGKTFIGKREVKLYDENSKIDGELLRDANQGMTLRVQSSIRNAVKAKHGLKVASVGGEAIDYSAIEAV